MTRNDLYTPLSFLLLLFPYFFIPPLLPALLISGFAPTALITHTQVAVTVIRSSDAALKS